MRLRDTRKVREKIETVLGMGNATIAATGGLPDNVRVNGRFEERQREKVARILGKPLQEVTLREAEYCWRYARTYKTKWTELRKQLES